MSDQPASEILTSRVLDYAGMGFLFVPPEVLVLEVAMNKDPINWPLVIASFLGCYVVGIILLTVGLKWEKIKPNLSDKLANSIGRVAHSGVTWAFILTIVAFGPVALVYVFSTSPPNSLEKAVSHPADATSRQSAEDQKQIVSLQTDAATNAKEAIQRDLEAAKHQVALLRSQLDAKTKELDAMQHTLQDPQNRLASVPVSPPIDMFSGQQKNLFIALEKVFGEVRTQQAELASLAHDLSKANNMGRPYYIPMCRIIVSSATENQQFAKFIEIIAQSQECQAEDAPSPPPLPRPTDADEPPPKPIVTPSPHSYIVVRYPKPEDIKDLPEPPMIGVGMSRTVPSEELNEKTAKFREQIAGKLLDVFQGCGLDARRSRKAEGSPGWPVDKWAIYIDLGTVQICR